MAEMQTNKERLKEITDSIEQGIRELFQSDRYRCYLSVMSRFHRYSVNNTMLIYMQMPGASLVAGFGKWKDQFGRYVKKGEKGITIIAPTPFKKKIEKEKLDPDTNLPILDESGNAVMEEKIVQIPMYKPVKVFDVSQTEGKPLPNLANELTGSVEQYEVFAEALRRSSPVPISFQPIQKDMDGFFDTEHQCIAIREGMSEAQTIVAMVHEITHSLLHNYEKARSEAQAVDETALPPVKKDRHTEEVEAESVAYAVCQYFGIETSENSFGYIASWSQGKELKELRDSLETINRTASGLIASVNQHFMEVCKERGIDPKKLNAPDKGVPEDDTPERFAADYCDYLQKLYDAGITTRPFSSGRKEELAAALASDVLRHGQFDGTREELARIAAKHNAPTASVLLERLEKLSDAWDKALTCAMEPYPFDDGTGPRSIIKVFEPGEPNKARDVVFVGPTMLCEKLMQELNDGTTTLRQVRELNQQRGEVQARTDALLRDAMTDQENLYLVGNEVYLHIQADRNSGFDYTLYDAKTLRLMDGGQFGVEGLGSYGTADPMEAACSEALSAHGIAPVDYLPVSLDMLETIQEANLPLDTTLDEYPVPDTGRTMDDLVAVGYTDGDMLPLTMERASELVKRDFSVYGIVDGGYAEMCFDEGDVASMPGNTIFCIPHEEWEASADFASAVAGRMERQEEREQAFLNHAGDCFAIYQVHLDDSDERWRDLRFRSFDRLREPPRKSDFALVYTAPLPEGANLETLYEQFNLNKPADYRHPSMSVSDIVAFKQDGVVSCHYCDSVGFVELPDFIKPENYLKNAELATEDDANMIDGIINNGPKQPTVAELEAQVKAGQAISLLDLANAVKAESKEKDERPSVLARLQKQPPAQKRKAPKKSAERDR